MEKKVKDCTLTEIVKWGRTNTPNQLFDFKDAEAQIKFCKNFNCMDLTLTEADKRVSECMSLVSEMIERSSDPKQVLQNCYSGLKDGKVSPYWISN